MQLEEDERERAENRVGVVFTDDTGVDAASRMPYSVYRPLVRIRQIELAELDLVVRALGYEDQATRDARRRTEMIHRQMRARTEWFRRSYTYVINVYLFHISFSSFSPYSTLFE